MMMIRTLSIAILFTAALFPRDIRVFMSDMPAPYTVRGEQLRIINASYSNIIADGLSSTTLTLSPKGVSAEGGVYQRIIVTASNLTMNGLPFDGVFIFSREGDALVAVNVVDLEDYVAGVLPYEMGPRWPLEALKAQAVAARTYALHYLLVRAGKGSYDVENTTKHQVYRGKRDSSTNVRAAVSSTAGEVMFFRNRVVPAYFHGSCGGYTEGTFRIFKIDIPYLRGGPCYYCTTNAKRWQIDVPISELNTIATNDRTVRSVTITEKDVSQRVVSLRLVGDGFVKEISAPALRKALGSEKLASLAFDITAGSNSVRFSGIGSGHGVGMCQWGAYGMAVHGFTYRTILENYYKLIEIRDARPMKEVAPDIWNISESYLNAFFSR